MSERIMIRKQLYITPEQDRVLKERARAEGLKEAEIVREALDRHLRHEGGPRIPGLRRKAVDDLIAMNEKVARRHRLPKAYKFDREELYAERENRGLRQRQAK